MTSTLTVSTPQELLGATAAAEIRTIRVAGELAGLQTVRLRPGQCLIGDDASAALRFVAGVDGVMLSADNAVTGLTIAVDPDRRALFNDTAQPGPGRLELSGNSVSWAISGCWPRARRPAAMSRRTGSTSWPPMRAVSSSGPRASAWR